jgi:hypothetical protein
MLVFPSILWTWINELLPCLPDPAKRCEKINTFSMSLVKKCSA